MTSVLQLPTVDEATGCYNAVVDTPKGSRNKYKIEEKTGQWLLSKILPLGMMFPYNFGFLPSTRGEDGDPLDVLLIADEPAFPGCVVHVRLIGAMEAEQTEKAHTVRNDRLVAVVETPYNPPEFKEIAELNPQRLEEIEQFFISYNRVEGRQFVPLGRLDARAAERIANGASA